MNSLVIYKAKENSKTYELVHGDSVKNIPQKESKPSWACMLCNSSTTSNCNMFQISNDIRFYRVCSDCLYDCKDFVDFCFGIGATKICQSYD